MLSTSLLLSIANASPIIIYALVILIVRLKWLGLMYMSLSLISDLINFIIKSTLQYADFKQPWLLRPNPPITGCGLFPNSSITNQIGMPSGHSQMVSFGTVFWLLYIYHQSNINTIYQSLISLILIFLSILIMYTRKYQGCHNSIQIVTGSLLGSVLGYISYQITQLIFETHF